MYIRDPSVMASHASISEMIWRVVEFRLCSVDGYTRMFDSQWRGTAFVPFYLLENPWHATCHRLRANAIWYDFSSTGPSLFLPVTHGFLSLCVYMSLCTSFHFILIHVPQALLTRLSQSHILFFLFPILILLSVFSERGLYICSAV